MQYDELVKSLRLCTSDKRGSGCAKECTYGKKHPLNGWCMDYLLKEAADAIEELSKPHWIPVEEGLPKADEYDARGYAVPYLVMNGWMRVTARRTKDYWVLFGNGTVLEYVTHWMPLPESPKGEDNEHPN